MSAEKPARGGSRPGAGRPPSSPTGERRQRWQIVMAPTVRAYVEQVAAQRGCSPSAFIESLMLAHRDVVSVA